MFFVKIALGGAINVVFRQHRKEENVEKSQQQA
jgi:hypothetical protein